LKYNTRPNFIFDPDWIWTIFKIYFNFLRIYSDPRLTQVNAKQWEAYEIAIKKYECFIWRTRRGGKTIMMSVLEVFWSLIEFGEAYPGVVVHKTPSGNQLKQLYKWFNFIPFVTNINRQTHMVYILESEPIWATMTTKDNVDGYGCSVLYEDEWGTVLETDLKATYLDSAREFLVEGSFRGKRHFHGSTLHYGSVGAKDMLLLEEMGFEVGETYVHVMTWRDCVNSDGSRWITEETIALERRKHFENPNFIKEMFECILVPGGGLFFSVDQWIVAGNPAFPDITEEYLNRFPIRQAGWDFNGNAVGHIEVRGYHDYENHIIIIREEKAWDRTDKISDHIKEEIGISHCVEGLPKADGYNAGFTQNLMELDTPCQYDSMRDIKQSRLATIQNSLIIIDPSCKWCIKNFREAIFDPKSLENKLLKTNTQHGLDGIIHMIHSTHNTIDFAKFKRQGRNPYESNEGKLWE